MVNEAQEHILKLGALKRKSKETLDSEKEDEPISPLKKRTRSSKKQVGLGGDRSSPQVNPTKTQLRLIDEPEEAFLL